MSEFLCRILSDECERRHEFPVCGKGIFLGHAGVTALPRRVADAVVDYTRASSEAQQEFGDVLARISRARANCARLIGAHADEIALLGPTSLGLSLVAHGLEWKPGDEIVCYRDDYPANVYPWRDLERLGVNVRLIEPESPGVITPELVAAAMSHRTKLVALASCHYLTGQRIDVDAIGRVVHEHGALFSLDAIQTLGAFETRVEHVDFLSADAHKWLLGPLTAGIFYVRRGCFELLHPTLIGAWNVDCPNFIAQEGLRFHPTARRYEPGVLNAAGIFGMQAAIEILDREVGIEAVSRRILELKTVAVRELAAVGCEFLGAVEGPLVSGITTFWHPAVATARIAAALDAAGIVASHRHDRQGRDYIRLSPHFYNTEEEILRVVEVVAEVVSAP